MRAVIVLLALTVATANAINVKTMGNKRLSAEVDATAMVDVSSAAAARALGQFSVNADAIATIPCAGKPSPGVCIDIDNFSCSGKMLTGKCAGDNTVLCCTGTPIENPNADGSTIPTTPFPVNPPPAQPPVAPRDVAFKATLTPSGIATVNALLNKVLQKQLKSPMVIPDQTLTLPTPQLGTFTLNVKNLALHDVELGPVALTVAPPATVSASVKGGNAHSDMDFSWQRTTFPRVGGDGHLQIAVTDVSVAFSLAITTSNGKLSITMTSATANMDKLNFKFSKSWDSFVLNAITTLFMQKIKPAIQSAVSTGVVGPFNAQMKTILDSLPLTTSFAAGDMKCTASFGFQTASAGADGLTLGESFAIDCE